MLEDLGGPVLLERLAQDTAKVCGGLNRAGVHARAEGGPVLECLAHIRPDISPVGQMKMPSEHTNVTTDYL